MSSAWMVRAGRSGGEHVQEFLEKGIVAIGSKELGKLAPGMTKEDMLALYAKTHPSAKAGSRGVWASQALRFLSGLQVGDNVATFDRERRLYLLGTCASEYEWKSGLVEDGPHTRRVTWTHRVSREVLGVATRNTLGSTLTVFKLPTEVWADLDAHKTALGLEESAETPAVARLEDEESEAQLKDDMAEKADTSGRGAGGYDSREARPDACLRAVWGR
jgi:restriction system protein